jgi:hypothetical protein
VIKVKANSLYEGFIPLPLSPSLKGREDTKLLSLDGRGWVRVKHYTGRNMGLYPSLAENPSSVYYITSSLGGGLK